MAKSAFMCCVDDFLLDLVDPPGWCTHFWVQRDDLHDIKRRAHQVRIFCPLPKVPRSDILSLRMKYGLKHERYAGLTLNQYMQKMYGHS